MSLETHALACLKYNSVKYFISLKITFWRYHGEINIAASTDENFDSFFTLYLSSLVLGCATKLITLHLLLMSLKHFAKQAFPSFHLDQ